jgi:peptide/nickel transport system permease protein
MRRSLTTRLAAPGRRLGALPIGSKIALGFFLVIVVAAVAAPLIAPYDPLASGIPAQPPSAAHLFGTDRVGRDEFSRLVFGARYSLAIGLGATVLALIVGSVVGAITATAPRWISETVMRVMDIVMSFPGIALAVVFVAVFGKSLPVLIATIAFLYVPQIARVVRANVLSQVGEDYVAAERVLGARMSYVLLRHVARNCAAPVMVFVTVLVADAIVFEASLSFIGAGVQDPAPSWGNVISSGRDLLLSGSWWATFFPGALILVTVLALNILAEGVTDAMVATAPSDAARAVKRVEQEVAPAEVAAAAAGLDAHLERLRVAETARHDRLLSADAAAAPLLEVQHLTIRFPGQHDDVALVDDVSFSVRPGETMALVGESGCGKSLTSLAIMGLLPASAEVTGSIRFGGRDLQAMPWKERQKLLGHDMSMVYQDALSSLNPSMLIRSQLAQLLRRGGTRSAEELLEMVGLEPARVLSSYPHELSGGQRQRVLIAMALTRDPQLVVADEPTTALDVTVQAQVVDLLNELRERLGFAMVFVSHDLALVAELAHRITVMYAGQVVESAPTRDLLTDPRHEYTRGLLGSVLSIEDGAERLHQIPGTVPSPRDFATGDRFAPRSLSGAAHRADRPELRRVAGTDHFVAAHDTDDLTMTRALEEAR